MGGCNMQKVLKEITRGRKKRGEEIKDFWDRIDRTALTMQNLVNTLLQAKEQEAKFFMVQVKTIGCDGLETIINPIENIDAKLTYYMQSYDKDLKLKANNNIQIVNFTFAFRWGEIRCECL